jgi:HSP20 family molecular chaperone IbpA
VSLPPHRTPPSPPRRLYHSRRIGLRGEGQRRLTLSGERTPDSAENGYHRRERPYGKFSRSIQLPVDLDIDHAEAKFNRGVMTLSIPQAAAAKPRQISVQAA